MKKVIVNMLLITGIAGIVMMGNHDKVPDSQNHTPEVKSEVIA